MVSIITPNLPPQVDRQTGKLQPVQPVEQVKKAVQQQSALSDRASDARTEQSPEVQRANQQADTSSVERVGAHLQSFQRDLDFSVDEASGKTVIKVMDSETKELIRQFPSEEVLDIAKKLEAGDSSILLDVQA